MKQKALKFLFLIILLVLSATPLLVNAFSISVNEHDLDSSNSGSFDNHECLDDMSGLNKRRLFSRKGYAYQSMTKANTVRMQYAPSIVYSDYVYQQCRGEKPATPHRFILTLSDQNPFDPKFTVTLDSVKFRTGYGIPGYGQTALMFNCDIYNLCLDIDWDPIPKTTHECWDDVCQATGWWNRYTQTFDQTEIRDWTDGNAGYGTKDLMAYRICLRSVPPGQPFNPSDPTNVNLVPDPDQVIPLGQVQDRNTTSPEKLASLYAMDSKGHWINASNRTKICAYNVQIKPDCDNPATKTAFAVGATIAGGMLGGPIGAVIVGAFAQQICALIAGDGPCFAPEVSWDSAFIGCVDVPIPPGPPILNATLPIVIKAVIDSKVIYPPINPLPTAGEKAPAEMTADVGVPFQQLIDTRMDNSLKIGGTFDQPIVQIVTGAASEDLFPGGTLSADDAQIYNKIKLRYKFPGDTETIDALPVCDTINSDYLNARFCAYYDEGMPDKICACVQDNTSFNDCYDPACTNSDRSTCPLTDQLIGCAVRPTPNRSSIQYNLTQSTVAMSKIKVLSSQTGINRPQVDYPSIQLRFKAWREKVTNYRVVQVGSQWFTSKDGWTQTAAVHTVDASNIEQYTLADVTGGNYNIPEYDFQGQTTTGGGSILENCMIVVDNNGSMLDPNYYDYSPYTTACQYTPNISRKFYGLNFLAIVPDYDDQNKVRQTEIITPDQVLPSATVVADTACHKNYNTCVKSYIAAVDFQTCWPQDMSSLANTGTKTLGMTMQYPVLSLPGQASARSFNGICDGLKLSTMVQKCGRTAAGTLLTGFNPSTPPTSTDFNFVVNHSDAEAMSAYCPGLLNEEDFEDMDISRICLSYPALKWPAVNKEIMDHPYDPDFSLRTCFRSSNKVCRGYLTPKGGNLPATPSDPTNNDTLPDDSNWTSWPRPPRATSPNNPVSGYCGSGYGVENYIQLAQNIGNFLTFARHPGFFQSSTYTIEDQSTFCSSFIDLNMPTVNATLYGPCGASQSYTFSVDQLNDTTINSKVTDFTNAYPACPPTADEITAFKVALYGKAANDSFKPALDITSYTVALNNAQNTYNSGIQVRAVYNANANLTCQNYNGCSGTFNVNTTCNQAMCGNGNNDCYNSTALQCQIGYYDSQSIISPPFTFYPDTFTQSQLDAAVATFTNQLIGSTQTSQSYNVHYNDSPDQYCPSVCNSIGVDTCHWKAFDNSTSTWYYCNYDYRPPNAGGAAAIQAFRDAVANQLNQAKATYTTAQVSYISGVQTAVQNKAATIATQCNLYYAAYSAGVTSISQDEMCNRVHAANPSISIATCKTVPITQKPICQKLVNDGGMPAAICNSIADASLKAVCVATESYTQATCNAISDPTSSYDHTQAPPVLHSYFVLGDALVAGIGISNGIISKLNQYATTTQNITLANGSVITGSHANIAALSPATSPYASYLAQTMFTANNVTLDGVTINLLPQLTTPTRTCDYSQNHRGCYILNGTNVCQNTCVKIEGCPVINKVSDFTGYAIWPAAPSGTTDVVVKGTCQIPQDVGVSTPRPQLNRTCKAINYSFGGQNYQYRYWADIDPTDPGTAGCLAASVNYW